MIYIVEDDAAIRELEQYALQSSGYEVTSFESSEPFWQAMHAAEPELVILDVMLSPVSWTPCAGWTVVPMITSQSLLVSWNF
mgnify:CR=1 FL=1